MSRRAPKTELMLCLGNADVDRESVEICNLLFQGVSGSKHRSDHFLWLSRVKPRAFEVGRCGGDW